MIALHLFDSSATPCTRRPTSHNRSFSHHITLPSFHARRLYHLTRADPLQGYRSLTSILYRLFDLSFLTRVLQEMRLLKVDANPRPSSILPWVKTRRKITDIITIFLLPIHIPNHVALILTSMHIVMKIVTAQIIPAPSIYCLSSVLSVPNVNVCGHYFVFLHRVFQIVVVNIAGVLP